MALIIGLAVIACSGGIGKSSKTTYVAEDGSSYTYSGDKVYLTAYGNVMEFTYITKDGKVYSAYISGENSADDDYSLDIEGIIFTKEKP
jgi:hypothetical protein